MKTQQNRLLIEQLDHKLTQAKRATMHVQMPSNGWINTIRTAIGMSLAQLGKRMDLTSPASAAKQYETGEASGSITINSLRRAANAMGFKLVYFLVPQEKSIAATIEKRALKLAEEIVLRTSHTMALEDQPISKRRILKAIHQKVDEIKNEIPRNLWD